VNILTVLIISFLNVHIYVRCFNNVRDLIEWIHKNNYSHLIAYEKDNSLKLKWSSKYIEIWECDDNKDHMKFHMNGIEFKKYGKAMSIRISEIEDEIDGVTMTGQLMKEELLITFDVVNGDKVSSSFA